MPRHQSRHTGQEIDDAIDQVGTLATSVLTLNNTKLNKSDLEEAIDEALLQAKESGEFKGAAGQNGRTPIKGIDYFTAQDKEIIVKETINSLSKESLGLGNVDNTADRDKPVSTYQENAINNVKNELQEKINRLSAQINTFLDSDNTALDQVSEIAAQIESIQNTLTETVKVADIIDNLVEAKSNQPLSANQGTKLKILIDALESNKLNKSDLNTAIQIALEQAKESGEFNGESGTSITHQWNGTYLEITSASGTSSANLQGPQGAEGRGIVEVKLNESGELLIRFKNEYSFQNLGNVTGRPGYTPIKGVDYFTDSDVDEITDIAAQKVKIPDTPAELEWIDF